MNDWVQMMDRLAFDASNVYQPEAKPEGVKMTHFNCSDLTIVLRNEIALLGGCAWREKVTGYPKVLHNLALAAYYILHLIEVCTISSHPRTQPSKSYAYEFSDTY